MAKVKVKLTLKDSEGCQLVIKIGGQTLDFQGGGTKTVELDPKRYTALIAGFQDPGSTDPIAKIEFLQDQQLLNEITITESSFIKPLRVVVK